MALSHLHPPPCTKLESLLRHPYNHNHNHCHKVSVVPLSLSPPRGLGARYLSLHRGSSKPRFVVSFAASQEDSKHSEIEVDKVKNETDVGANESQEAWERMLESFKEQTLKMQGMSKEAYELYSKKAAVILNETSNKLKIQAEKASQDLSIIANEISTESKEYLSEAAKKSPEEVKDIVETFASTDDLKEVSKVRDFYLGIPYGTFLFVGGFLSFMITGSTSAIRFGVILGGALLALSVSSLRSWKKQESSDLALKGQTAIASILFLRELRFVSQRATLPNLLTTLISGAMVMFYLYRIKLDGKKSAGPSVEN